MASQSIKHHILGRSALMLYSTHIKASINKYEKQPIKACPEAYREEIEATVIEDCIAHEKRRLCGNKTNESRYNQSR